MKKNNKNTMRQMSIKLFFYIFKTSQNHHIEPISKNYSFCGQIYITRKKPWKSLFIQ